MGSPALDGASKYLNNLLLARGFLHDGKSIDFSKLAGDGDTADKASTTARVVNLIHDLVLRRDRDAEQRQALASTIHGLRAEESQRLLDLQKLQDKIAQLKNELSSAEAQQRTLGVAAKKAQAETRELKEQALKMKSTLDQVRAKCISDIRKRDVELDKLKNHLSGLNRGKKESSSGGMKINTVNLQKSNSQQGRTAQDSNTSQWTLENETNDFLAAVVNETSTENVALRKIIGDSMRYLKTLTGLEEERPASGNDLDNAIGIPGQYRDRNMTSSAQSETLIPVQQLATSMSQVLSYCQTILRDPSFVPIEEVQVRDDEIAKLKGGWERMADRWKEAVTMMAQWRQQVLNNQEHGNESFDAPPQFDSEGFSGMTAFGRSVARRPDGQPVLDPIEEEELTSMLTDHHSRIGNQSTISTAAEARQIDGIDDETLPEPEETGTPRQLTVQIYEDQDESDLEPKSPAPQQTIASPARRGLKLQVPGSLQRQPLIDANANARKRKSPPSTSSPRKRRSFSPAGSIYESEQHYLHRPTANSSGIVSSASTNPLHLDTLSSGFSGDEIEIEDDADLFLSQDAASKSKIPRMTVAEKLAAVEAEASEATEVIRRRQATTYSKDDRRARDRASKINARASLMASEKAAPVRPPPKHKEGFKKARDRRRSTLTPAELGSLMNR